MVGASLILSPQTVVLIVFHDFADQILRMGIDEIYCISVNDAFVMRQWGVHQGLKEDRNLAGQPVSILNPGNFTTIKLIPDGAAKFTRAMGMNCKPVVHPCMCFARLISQFVTVICSAQANGRTSVALASARGATALCLMT
jgi:hypothetical protein